MNKMFKIATAAAMVGLMAFAAGCGGGDKKADKKAAAKDTLKMGVTNFADSFEPTENYFGWVVMRYGVGECLTKFDKKMVTSPWLCDKWSVSDDKLTWTFHINDKATFSNGNKVTGEAVKKSIERTFKMAKRAQSMFQYTSIKADGQNVMITTKEPIVTLPGMLGDPLFIIVDADASAKIDTRKMGPICTGPYVTESFTKAKFVGVRNEKYWGGEVPFKKLEVPSIDDPNTRAMALQKGEIDVAVNIASGDMALFRGKDKFTVSEIPSLRVVLSRINVRPDRVFGDPAVRHAFLKCLDRDTYAKSLLKGTFYTGGPYMAPSTDYGWKELMAEYPDKYDVEGAKKLLDAAGWKDTDGDGIREKNGKKLEADLITYSSRAELPTYSEAAQASAKAIGMKINVKLLDYNVTDKETREGRYDLSVCNTLTMQAGDAETFMKMYLMTGQEQNGSGYSNKEFDALGHKLTSEFDPAKRKQIVIDMQKIIAKDGVGVIFGTPMTNMVSSKAVTGAEIFPCDYYWFTTDIKPAK